MEIIKNEAKEKIGKLAARLNLRSSYTDRYNAIKALYLDLMKYDHDDYIALEIENRELKKKSNHSKVVKK